MRIETKGGKVVESPYSYVEAVAHLAELVNEGRVWTDFAQDLLRVAAAGRASEEQSKWVHVVVVEAERLAAAPAPAPEESYAALVEFLDAAARNLRRPKVTVEVDGTRVQIARAGAGSREPGSVQITDGGPYGSNRWFGRVCRDGRLHRGREMTSAVEAVLGWLRNDPADFAGRYGRRTGNCCFCDRQIETAESLAVGYGPVCAENFGLPWGPTAEEICEASERREVERSEPAS